MLLPIFYAFFTLVVVVTDEASAGVVIRLNSTNYREISAQYEFGLVNFYARWCHYSQSFSPIYSRAARKILKEFPEPNKVLFAKVDCTHDDSLAHEFHLKGYPTQYVLRYGELLPERYFGNRTVDDLVLFVREQLRDVVKEVTSDLSSIDERRPAVISFLTTKDSASYQAFRRLASEFRDECDFHIVPRTFKQGDVSQTIVFKEPFTPYDSARLRVYNGTVENYDLLLEWFLQNEAPEDDS